MSSRAEALIQLDDLSNIYNHYPTISFIYKDTIEHYNSMKSTSPSFLCVFFSVSAPIKVYALTKRMDEKAQNHKPRSFKHQLSDMHPNQWQKVKA